MKAGLYALACWDLARKAVRENREITESEVREKLKPLQEDEKPKRPVRTRASQQHEALEN